jgi:hypothetical protein
LFLRQQSGHVKTAFRAFAGIFVGRHESRQTPRSQVLHSISFPPLWQIEHHCKVGVRLPSDASEKLTCACPSSLLATSRVFLLDAVVERVAVTPDTSSLLGGIVATVTSGPGIIGSSSSERDLRGAGPLVDRLAICFILAMFASSPRPLTRRSSLKKQTLLKLK